MALAITSGTPAITETQANYTVSWSGASYGGGYSMVCELLINDVVVNSATNSGIFSANGSYAIPVDDVQDAIYTNATGKSLATAVKVRIKNYYGTTLLGTATSSAGVLTIGRRHTGVSLTSPTAGQTIDLDQTVDANQRNITLSWTRPHSAFQARIKISMGNATTGSTTWYMPFNRWGFSGSTGTNLNLLWVVDTNYSQLFLNKIIEYGASPKELKVEVVSQFVDNSSTNKDLATVATFNIASAFTHLFFSASTINTYSNFAIGTNPTVTLNPGNGTIYHKLVLSLTGWSKTVLWGTTTSGTVAFDGNDWAGILAQVPANGTQTTVALDVLTYSDSGYTTQIGTTSSASALATTSASTIYGLTDFAIEGSGVGAFSFTPAYSGYTFTVNYKIGTTLIKTVSNGSGVTFTTAEKQAIYGTFANGNTAKQFTVQLLTYYGTKQIGTTSEATAYGLTARSTVASLSGTTFNSVLGSTINTPSITINKESALFNHTILIKRNGVTFATFSSIMTGSTTSYTTTLNNDQQVAIITATTDAKQASLTVELQTYYSSTLIGSVDATAAFTLLFPNTPAMHPTIPSLVTPTEGNAANTSTYFVKNNTRLILGISANPTAAYGATIASKTVSFDSKTYALNPSTNVATTDTVTSTSSSYTITVTDSRGYTSTSNGTVTIYPYTAPTVTYSTYRWNGSVKSPIGTFLGIDFETGGVNAQAFGATNANTLTIVISTSTDGVSYTTKETINITAGNFTTLVPFKTDKRYSGYPIENSFYVKVVATDYFNSTTSIKMLGTGAVIMSQLKDGVGIMKIRQQGALDVNGDIYMNGTKVSVNGHTHSYLPLSGGTLTDGGGITRYTTNPAIYHNDDVRDDGTGVTPHKFRRNATGYLTYKENWWDGSNYHAIEMRTDGLYSDGTKVSLNGHTHNYAGSASAGGVANNAVGLSNSGYGNSDTGTLITAYQTTTNNLQTWTGGYASHIILNHGDGSYYYNNIMIFPFWGPPQYMRKESGVNKGPWVFWTSENSTGSVVTTSTSQPSGGKAGDIWFVV